MRLISTLLLFVLALLGVGFAILNAELVNLNYYFGNTKMPLSLLLVFTLGIGLLVGFIYSSKVYIKLKRDNRRLQGKLKLVEKEIENLRAIPLKDPH